jgi:DNA-binding NarL/FixJ family response regulator
MQGKPNHVYIVDDSQPVRARLAHLLRSLPHVTVAGEAGSANEAIAGILRLRPDSVLLDLNLMGGTGIEVMRKVRTAAPEVVFIVLTNHFEAQYRDACLDAGAAYFLDKSCELDKVAGVLAEIAQTHH